MNAESGRCYEQEQEQTQRQQHCSHEKWTDRCRVKSHRLGRPSTDAKLSSVHLETRSLILIRRILPTVGHYDPRRAYDGYVLSLEIDEPLMRFGSWMSRTDIPIFRLSFRSSNLSSH